MKFYTYRGNRYKRILNTIKPGNCTPCALNKIGCASSPSCLDEKYIYNDLLRYYIYVEVISQLNTNIKVI